MYVYPKLNSETDAVAVKSFMTSDKMEAKWSHVDGKSVLILAMAEVDKTGASYYGKTQVCSFEVQQLPGKPSYQHNLSFQLCYANVEGDTAMVPLGKDGPIYSFEWAPNLKPVMFAVVYGYMPAKATLYNKKCEAVFDFGTGPR